MCITAGENAPRDLCDGACAHSAEANPSPDRFMTDKICQIISELMKDAAAPGQT